MFEIQEAEKQLKIKEISTSCKEDLRWYHFEASPFLCFDFNLCPPSPPVPSPAGRNKTQAVDRLPPQVFYLSRQSTWGELGVVAPILSETSKDDVTWKIKHHVIENKLPRKPDLSIMNDIFTWAFAVSNYTQVNCWFNSKGLCHSATCRCLKWGYNILYPPSIPIK